MQMLSKWEQSQRNSCICLFVYLFIFARCSFPFRFLRRVWEPHSIKVLSSGVQEESLKCYKPAPLQAWQGLDAHQVCCRCWDWDLFCLSFLWISFSSLTLVLHSHFSVSLSLFVLLFPFLFISHFAYLFASITLFLLSPLVLIPLSSDSIPPYQPQPVCSKPCSSSKYIRVCMLCVQAKATRAVVSRPLIHNGKYNSPSEVFCHSWGAL